MDDIFKKYGAAICRDQLDEKLRRALAPFTFDGTENHHIIGAELRGLEFEISASNIRHANVAQFGGCVPLDATINVLAKMIEDGNFSGLTTNPVLGREEE
jgi:hypothetical protein